MRAFPEIDRDAREHVDGTIFLHITAGLDDDPTPVAPNRGAGTDVHVPADDYVACDGCLRMNEGAFMYHRAISSKFVKHNALQVFVVELPNAILTARQSRNLLFLQQIKLIF
jgi:hypothetical protein